MLLKKNWALRIPWISIIKIENDFHFRFKVQKFVFLAKFFGWDHNYKFKFYPKGVYSISLAKEYYSILLCEKKCSMVKFDEGSFNEFVKGKSSHDLDALSTILYFKSFNGNLSLKDASNILNEFKPHIDSATIEKAYFDVNDIETVGNLISPLISLELMKNIKSDLLFKIVKFIGVFEKFELSYNSKFIVLSLNYLKCILIKETLDVNLKWDLLMFISLYVSKIEEIYGMINCDRLILKKLNLSGIKKYFKNLENYIAYELDVFSKIQ